MFLREMPTNESSFGSRKLGEAPRIKAGACFERVALSSDDPSAPTPREPSDSDVPGVERLAGASAKAAVPEVDALLLVAMGIARVMLLLSPVIKWLMAGAEEQMEAHPTETEGGGPSMDRTSDAP